jgi:hypothetical protein
MDKMAIVIDALTGKVGAATQSAGALSKVGNAVSPATAQGGGKTLASTAQAAQTSTMTGYGEKLAKRATPQAGQVVSKTAPEALK